MTYSVIVRNIYISKYNALNGSSYIKLPRELHHSRKNKGLKWFLVRYLNVPDYHAARILRIEKNFARKIDCKNNREKKIGRKKSYCVLIKKFKTFMYNQTLYRDNKHFCRYCLKCFTTAQILERHVVNDCFKSKTTRRWLKWKQIRNFVREKENHYWWFMQILKEFYYQKIYESKTQISLMRFNIKIMLVAILIIN